MMLPPPTTLATKKIRRGQPPRCRILVLLGLGVLASSVRFATGFEAVEPSEITGTGAVGYDGEGRGFPDNGAGLDDDDDDARGDDNDDGGTLTTTLAFDLESEPSPDERDEQVGGDDDSRNDDDSQGIVGGVPTTGQSDAPFFVRGEYGCGAALIAPDVVIGAAHCAAFYGSKVLVGAFQRDSTSGGLAVCRAVTSDIKVHPKYQASGNSAPSYDMVLFKIQSAHSYPNLRPVMLNPDASAMSPGSTLTMVGFGYTNWNESQSSVLLKADVTALANADCEQRYGRKPGFFDASVTCTMSTPSSTTSGGTAATSCFGDSGGPMVDATGRLVGIISFGTKYCDPKYPSGSMNVATAMPWIVETACKLTDVQLPFCPKRTASPTRVPVAPPPTPTRASAPPPTIPSPTQPKSPTISTAGNCQTVERCATIVKQVCGCPSSTAPRTRCFKRAVKRRCCRTPSPIRTAYFLQAQVQYRTTGCGLAS